MYSNNKIANQKTPDPLMKYVVLLFFVATSLFSAMSAYSQEGSTSSNKITFTVKPIRCVTLHQGQECYQKIDFSWHIPKADRKRYCLFDATHSSEILCWNDNDLSSHSIEFESKINITYQLRADGENQVLGETIVEVAWVYKSRRSNSSRWRLF